jgi:hypothetical protein
MSTKTFPFDRLLPPIATQILKYLSIADLYILERTCQATRQLVLHNNFLKYTYRGQAYSDPLVQLNGRYTVHHGDDRFPHHFGEDPNYVEVFYEDNSWPPQNRKKSRRYKFLETSLAKVPAVYPPLEKLVLRQRGKEDEMEVVATGRYVTFEDIIKFFEKNYEELQLEGMFYEGLGWITETTFQVYRGS